MTKTFLEQGKLEMILVAVELGYTYCEKGYSLDAAKIETERQLRTLHPAPANNGGNK